ncbi:TPA: tyrosine-type recombinase/integrase [Streptococcus suis]
MNYDTIQKYLDFCAIQRRLSSHTIRAYKSDLHQYYNFGTNDIRSYLTFLNQHIKKTSTLKRKIASLKSYYKFLEEEKLISKNPFHQLRLHYKEEKKLPKTISLKDLQKIYCFAHQQIENSKNKHSMRKAMRNLLLISLLLSTGLRISELCNLKLDNINLENRTIQILGKGKKERLLYIGNDETLSLLEDYIAHHCSHSSYLFTGVKNDDYLKEQSVRLILKNISHSLQLKKHITPHMFRHSFATMLLDNGVDIRQIQHLLGHSNINVTQIYTHVSQSKQVEILSEHNPLNQITPLLRT